MKKIDFHCHTSNRPINDVIDSDASIDNILRYMDQHEIEKTVLLATYFPHKGSGISNYRLHHWIRDRRDRFYMFGSLDFETYYQQGFNELNEMAEYDLIAGIKVYTCYQNIDLNTPKMVDLLDMAQHFNLPVMFHTGYSYSAYRKYHQPTIGTPHSASTLEYLLERWKQVKFIFSHLSKPFFNEIIAVVTMYPNVYTDVSGIIDSQYDAEEIPTCINQIRRLVSECGHERLLFGTDFPVQTHAHSVAFVEASIPNRAMQADVFYNNAEKLLRRSLCHTDMPKRQSTPNSR